MKQKACSNTFKLLFLSLFICAVCILLLFATAVRTNAASIVASGNCGDKGDNVKWSLDSDGTLTIVGKGRMKDYDFSPSAEAPWGAENENIKRVEVKEGITHIGNNSFCSEESMKSVVLPSSCSNIGRWAFEDCWSLERIVWPKVKTIGEFAFCNCGFSSLNLPETLESIGDYAFDTCYRLRTVSIPKSVTAIGECAFTGCEELTKVSIPDSVRIIGFECFTGCKRLKSAIISSEIVASNAFEGCEELKSVSITESVKKIEDYAFAGCVKLGSIKIQNGLQKIEAFAFSSCGSLKSIEFPVSVNSIGDYVFSGCDKLRQVKILNRNCSIALDAFEESLKTMYGYKDSTAEAYVKRRNLVTNAKISFVIISDADHRHTYGAVITTKATTSKDGMRKKTCEVCGQVVKVEIPKISSILLKDASFAYTGTTVTPFIFVKDRAGKQLKKDKDYTLAYAKGRKDIGTYAVKVTFKGNYFGSKKVKFKIVPAQVTGLKQQNRKGINFEWKPVAYADYYEIYYYEGTTGKHQFLGKTSKLTFGNSKITKNSTMRFKVRAVARDKDDQLYYGNFSKELTAVAK